MAEEEKKQKKKSGITRRIFKWLWIGFLALLLTAGIFFQAPWKVLALLLIILLEAAVLPKLPKRFTKCFWQTVAVVVIMIIVWVFLPDNNNDDWKPYKFKKEIAALQTKYAIPDEENAAMIYTQLLEKYDDDTNEPNFVDGDCYDLTREPWSSDDHPEQAQWLKGQESTIETLMLASKMEKCRFPIATDTIMLQTMNRLPPMRRWAYLLVRAANNDFGEGRIDEAIEKNIALLQMGKHQRQQPDMIETLVGMAIEALAIDSFNRFVVTSNPTEKHLTIIEKAVTDIKHDWNRDLPGFLDTEKIMTKSLLAVFYETNSKGKVRLSRNPTAAMRIEFPEEMPPLNYWQKKLLKASTILSWFFMPSTPQKAGQIIDTSYEKLYAMAEPDFDWNKKYKGPGLSLLTVKFNYRFMTESMTSIAEPVYHRIHDLYLRLHSDRNASLILIGLRRYKNENGSWPGSLDDIKDSVPTEILIDPINNDSFVYKLTDDDFTLYSKGKNNIDDGGIHDKWGEEETGADDWLIWPLKGYKNKKENVDVE